MALISGVRIALDNGQSLELGEAVVVDFPSELRRYRFAGLLSPQLLAGSGEQVNLDLRGPTLTIRPLESALTRVSAAFDDTRVCRNSESAFVNRLYGASISLVGQSASVLLDTGSTTTVLNRDSPAMRALQFRSIEDVGAQGVGGGVLAIRRIPNVVMQRGRATTMLDLNIGKASSSCGPDGLLGMDALRECSIVFSEASMSWSCDAAIPPGR